MTLLNSTETSASLYCVLDSIARYTEESMCSFSLQCTYISVAACVPLLFIIGPQECIYFNTWKM